MLERKLKPEDVELYVFGFSRGAYQARLFVELISRFGLPMTVDSATMKVARFALGIRGKRKELLPALNSSYQRMIRFLGLFDMVRALWHKDIYSKLGPLPNHIDVRHALAIHEKRSFFFPALEDAQCSQVMWFAGVHSDVGWGYNREGEKASTLGLISISWMLKNLPLTLKHEFSRIPYCFMDMLLLFSCFGFLRHESYRGLWKLLLQRSRKRIMGNKHPTVKAVEEVISELNIHPAMLWRTRFMSESLRKYLNCRGIRKSQKKLLRNIAEVNKIFLRYKVYQSPCQLPTCLISRATGPCLFPRQDRLS